MARGRLSLLCASVFIAFMTACGGGGGNTVTQVQPTTPTVSVIPASSSVTTVQALSVLVSVSGGSGVATGTVTLKSGNYTSAATSLVSGSATISIPAESLAAGTDTLSVAYTPDAAGSTTYTSASGSSSVTVKLDTPAVTVTPAAITIVPGQSISVAVAVSGGSGAPTATGTIVLATPGYTSAVSALSGGSVNIVIPPNSLPDGNLTLTATYTPDTAGAVFYIQTSGTAGLGVGVLVPTVTVTPASPNITAHQSLSVTVAVAITGIPGLPPITGSVKLSSGNFYVSSVTNLSNGSATITIPAGTLSPGTDTLTATYTPDTASAVNYASTFGTGTVTVGAATPTVRVGFPTNSINTQQTLSVDVAVSGGTGDPMATGSVVVTSGSFNSGVLTLSSGIAGVQIPAATLLPGNDTVTASYTPDNNSSTIYTQASGQASITVSRITPSVTVTPASTSINTSQSLQVTVAVANPGAIAPTGSVTLNGGGYTSPATTLVGDNSTGIGSATITIAAGALSTGSDTLTATYTTDSASSEIYNTANGSSAAIAVTLLSTVNVDQSSSGPAVTDQLLGVNMEMWYDIDSNKAGIQTGLEAAGIKAVRWPGGSSSDNYHWKTNTWCGSTYSSPNSTYINFINDLEIPIGFDVALTANYGSDEACTGGGDPTEAAAWVQYAEANGGKVSHVTVGNEQYGSWEYDLHAKPNDPTTYAAAAVTYYSDIKAVDKNVLVGVDVDAGGTQPGWDSTVLANAKGSYDFVEFHYYPEAPKSESDSTLIHNAATGLTNEIKIIENELVTAGNPGIPIYVGEIGGPYSDPGKQSWSITQGLYAGQVLGEMMNAGISRLTWWDGYGNCNGGDINADNSSDVYGWQTWGAYSIFSDGPSETSCPNAGAIGTMSPTAQAFNLFQHVLVNGENALTATSAGNTTDVRAYAATHSGGTAVVLFNLNQTTSEPVQITLSNQNSSAGVAVITYSKAIYDDTKNGKWDPPTTTNMGAQSLPLTLTLDPWSMNVVILQ